MHTTLVRSQSSIIGCAIAIMHTTTTSTTTTSTTKYAYDEVLLQLVATQQ